MDETVSRLAVAAALLAGASALIVAASILAARAGGHAVQPAVRRNA